jgi:hypothetical protein
MSLQFFPRSESINCGMTFDQTLQRGNLSVRSFVLNNSMPSMTHQSWQIHSDTGRMELRDRRVRSFCLSTLPTVLVFPPREEYTRKTNIIWRSVMNWRTLTLKSSLFTKSNDLGGYYSGPAKRILGPLLRPNTIQSPNFTFGIIACNIPSLREGGARSKRDRFKQTLTSLCTFCTFPQ